LNERATTAYQCYNKLVADNVFLGRLFSPETSMSDMETPSPQPDLNRNRLPTLFEVLSRQTLAPVDLFSFYIYMRDQQRSVDYLDFW